MTALLPLLFAATTATATAATLSADERVPVIAVVLTPRDGESRFDVTTVRRGLDDQLRSPFQLVPSDPALERCAGSPACIVSNLEAGDSASRLLFVLSLRGDGYITCTVFDLPRARDLARQYPEPTTSREQLDGILFDEASLAESTAKPTDIQGLALALETPIAAAIARVSDVPDRGAIALDVDLAGAVMDLDGRTLGLSTGGLQRVVDVAPGSRTLQLAHPDHPPVALLVDVPPGGTATASFALRPAPFVFPHATVWPTVALLGLGATFTGLGITRLDDVRSACFPPACAAVGAGVRVFANDGAGAGPLAVPLGYSLAASAIGYLAARQLAGDDAPWWLAPLVAASVGALTYTVSEVVEAAR
jgi:hypothetical protein